ncbi:ZnF-C3H1 domain-containing protein [Pyrenophora tritici-repentis]|uniref:ZnF-C3H1 domain containing protein n=1 Tax=Pyrenophora tritici-repentis TaxID=45151 RepID=A0A834RUP6_9PLEO|nr:ZnF-C3H1 domain containing protein [Pyrenophora tritici-repentis]KAI0616623.1 ZnF-C3H1 domain-containing protein [Pyrenophora tritici-repentis]KAI1509901.1 ZnF-C3H1 domain containing protein [Pyrenophora tritici-repentis]
MAFRMSKRKAEDSNSTSNSARNVRPRSEGSFPLPSPLVLPETCQYQLKVLANIPENLPFFTMTALTIAKSCALESQATPYLVSTLVEALRDEGADEKKVDTARAIWENSSNLCKAKEIGAMLGTVDILQKGLYFLIEGAKECPSSQITAQLQRRLNAAIAECLASEDDEIRVEKAVSESAIPTNLEGSQGASRSIDKGQKQSSEAPKLVPNYLSYNDDSSASHIDGLQSRASNEDKRGSVAREATSANLDTIDQLISDEANAAKARPSTAPYWGKQQDGGNFDSQSKADILVLLEAGLGGPVAPSATDWLRQESSNALDTEVSSSKALPSGSSNKQPADRAKDLLTPSNTSKSLKAVPSINGAPPIREARMPSIDMEYHETLKREPQVKTESTCLDSDRVFSDQAGLNLAYGTASTGNAGYKLVTKGHTQSKRRLPDRPLSKRVSSENIHDKDPTQSTPDCLTCFFWFSRGFCERGDRCKFRHQLQDYVASCPKSGGMPIKVIPMSTMEETRKATLASDPSHVSVRDRRNDPKSNFDPALTDTPILDLLLDDCIPIEPGSASRVISSIISNIRARKDRSQGDFVTDLYDYKGRPSNFDLYRHSGLPSKLGGAMSKVSYNPDHARRRLDEILRPFVEANKNMFPDLPERTFKKQREEGGRPQANWP